MSWSGRWKLGLELNSVWICEFLGSVSRICSSKSDYPADIRKDVSLGNSTSFVSAGLSSKTQCS